LSFHRAARDPNLLETRAEYFSCDITLMVSDDAVLPTTSD
jgi:hypothetical protein